MAHGQWIVSPEGTRWWFDSGALSLDLAYTGSMPETPVREQWRTPHDLGEWLSSRFDRYADDPAERDLVDARALRDAIGRLALAAAAAAGSPPDDIDTVNLFAATPDIAPSLEGGNRQAGRGRIRTGQALATIARDAVDLFGHNTEHRIRECSAADCTFVFFDESRTNNRRWCSMQRCGNRAKVRAFRAKPAAQRQSPTVRAR